MLRRLLVIDDGPMQINPGFHDLSTNMQFVYERVAWASFSAETINRHKAELILLVAMPEVPHCIVFLRRLQEGTIVTPSLAILPANANDEILRVASEACDDFLIAPLRPAELRQRIARVIGETGQPAPAVYERLSEEIALKGLVGQHPSFLGTIAAIPSAARSNCPVLILGETGTGKELCAHAIHSLGPRRNQPFLPVDCATIPEHLFENELFGHMRGAFTDARYDHKGLVALAEGGTLFLDEIDSLSLAAQAKLLRFLQERTYRPLGAERFLRADVNVVAASNSDLARLVRDKTFRSDLFFRLNVLQLYLVPLRERRSDIALLAQHFIKTISAEIGVPPKMLTAATIRKLSDYNWPGNVRELHNAIHKAIIVAKGNRILPSEVLGSPDQGFPKEVNRNFKNARTNAIERFERAFLDDLMRECDGNISRAARLAQQDRRALGRLIKRYGISREVFCRTSS